MNTRKRIYMALTIAFWVICFLFAIGFSAFADQDASGTLTWDSSATIDDAEAVKVEYTITSKGGTDPDKDLYPITVSATSEGITAKVCPSYTSNCGKENFDTKLTFNFYLNEQIVSSAVVANITATAYDKNGSQKASVTGAITTKTPVTLEFQAADETSEQVFTIEFSIKLIENRTVYFAPAWQTESSLTISANEVQHVLNSEYSCNEGIILDSFEVLSSSIDPKYLFEGWSAKNEAGEIVRLGSGTVISLESLTAGTWIVSPMIRKQESNATAPFLVKGTSYRSFYLDEAAAYAQSLLKTQSSAVIIVDRDASVAIANGQDCVIPAGVTLLIPNDASNTVYDASPKNDGGNTYTAPYEYRRLTLAEGANITVNGAISVAGKIGTYMGGTIVATGAPSGSMGFIDMKTGSTITINKGANLYAWGYIIGDGAVEVSGTVYEAFQITDWRGGTVTSNMLGNEDDVFPLSQYYIQNIQVPLTLNAGATEKVASAVTISIVGVQVMTPELVGTNGLFRIASGCLIKDYDETTGRMIYTVKGNISISNLTLSLKLGVLGTKTINSQDYVLPIHSGMTINIASGEMSVTQDICLLPGAQVNILSGATATLGEGKSIFVYDEENWGRYCYFNGTLKDEKCCPILYVPTGKIAGANDVTSPAKIRVDGVLDASAGGLYTTNAGASIYSTTDGQVIIGTGNTKTVTYQFSQIADSEDSLGKEVYVDIRIVSAKLQHGDGTYLETTASTADAGTTYYYHFGTGQWSTTPCGVDVTKRPTCTESGSATFSCEICGNSTVTLESPGHDYNTGVITTAPTCTETGVKTFTCYVCGDKYTETVQATGHKPGAAATCTTAQTCTVCGTILVAAKGHTPGAAATCTTAQTCTVCKATLVAAKGHAPGAAATCTTAQTCTVCGAELNAATGHTEVIDSAVAATCTESGLTEGSHCSVCNEVLVAQQTVAALGHTEVIDAAVDATCTDGGLTEGKHCSVCGEVTVEQEEVPALGHSYKPKTTDATCTEDGKTVFTCSVCNDSYEEVVRSTGHSYGDWKDNGDNTKTRSCTKCGESETKLSVTVTPYYYVQDFLYYNATIPFASDPGEVMFYGIDGNEIAGFGYAYDSANDLLYIMRMLPSDEIMNSYSFSIEVGGIRSETFTVNFESYADDLGDDSKYKAVATAITKYGTAAKEYFGNGGDIEQGSAELQKEPKNNIITTGIVASDESFDTYGASVIFDERIALKIYFDGTITFDTTKYEYQLGILRGAEDSEELTTALANSGGCSAVIAYNTLTDVNVSDGSGVPSAIAGKYVYSSNLLQSVNLLQKPAVVFNLESTEYGDRFAIRAFLVVREKSSDTATVYYGKQVVYGLEDYVYRMLARDDKELKELGEDKPFAFKDFLIEAWNYALAAEETNW